MPRLAEEEEQMLGTNGHHTYSAYSCGMATLKSKVRKIKITAYKYTFCQVSFRDWINVCYSCTSPSFQVTPRVPAPQLPLLTTSSAALTPEQQKRRHIVASLVHSENNYVATLQRLVQDYKTPLEESNPPILSPIKVSTLFHKIPEILQCHLLFRIALSEAVKNWDADEKIGDVFVASFSKAMVLEIYSDFINNFR
jgi:hypothetical protein